MATVTIKEFRKAYETGKLIGVACNKCGATFVTYIAVCSKCGAQDLRVVEFSGKGEVRSFTIQSVPSEKFVNEAPYTYAIIRLEEGADIAGWLPYVKDAKDIKVGEKVQYIKSYKPGLVFIKEGEAVPEERPKLSPEQEIVYY